MESKVDGKCVCVSVSVCVFVFMSVYVSMKGRQCVGQNENNREYMCVFLSVCVV